MKSGRRVGVSSALLCIVVPMLFGCAASLPTASTQEQEEIRSGGSVPVWWADYRERGRERGKLSGGGSAKHRDRKQADAEALEAAERDLHGWMKRRIEEVALWFAQSQPRSSKRVLSQPIEDIVEEALGESVGKSKMYRTEGFLRSDGRIQVYVWVEVDAGEISTHVARALVEQLAEIQPERVPALVQEVEDRLRVAFDAKDQSSRPIPAPPTPSSPRSPVENRLSIVGGHNLMNRAPIDGAYGLIFGVGISLANPQRTTLGADLLFVQKAPEKEIGSAASQEVTTGMSLIYVVVHPNARLYIGPQVYALLGMEIGYLLDDGQWLDPDIALSGPSWNPNDPSKFSFAPSLGFGFDWDSIPIFGEMRYTVALGYDEYKYRLPDQNVFQKHRSQCVYLLLGVPLWD